MTSTAITHHIDLLNCLLSPICWQGQPLLWRATHFQIFLEDRIASSGLELETFGEKSVQQCWTVREHSVLLNHCTRFKHNPQLETLAVEAALNSLLPKPSQLALTDQLSRQTQQSDVTSQFTGTARPTPSAIIRLPDSHLPNARRENTPGPWEMHWGKEFSTWIVLGHCSRPEYCVSSLMIPTQASILSRWGGCRRRAHGKVWGYALRGAGRKCLCPLCAQLQVKGTQPEEVQQTSPLVYRFDYEVNIMGKKNLVEITVSVT